MIPYNLEQLSWDIDTCPFCDLLAGEPWLPFRQFFTVAEAPSELMYETESFGVAADIGMIVEGYSLIISKEHIPSLACSNQLDELDHVKQKLRLALQATYGDSILFEHGAANFYRNAGCCIDHAHLHVVPSRVDLLPYLRRDYPFRPIANVSELCPLARKRGYLFYEDREGCGFVAEVGVAPSQYFRRVLCLALGNIVPWDWRDYIRFAQDLGTRDKIGRTREKLIPALQRFG